MTDFDIKKIYNSLNNYYHTKAFLTIFDKVIYFISIIENIIINYLYINYIIILLLIRNI